MFVAYVHLVAKESIKKFMNDGIIIEVSTTAMNGLEAPAFTISRLGPRNFGYGTNKFKICIRRSKGLPGI